MMATGNGPLSVPPGFRFHPTDEELLYYYLRKKVSYEAIDLDVIREVDLNKLEPWDLKDKCRIGSGPQNEWYFFSHKDKKYPTGTRTNRATTAGFWKATGRDKAIHLLSDSKRIGMRKTLVFYTGRAPHGQKTDWIMHEYRLDEQCSNLATSSEVQEEGWVVCRVFKKKNHNRNPFHADDHQDHSFQDKDNHLHLIDQEIYKTGSGGGQSLQQHALHSYDCNIINTTIFDSSMHLPQLLTSPHDQISYFLSPREGDNLVNNNNNASNVINTMINNDMGCPRNLLSLMSASRGAAIGGCRNGYQLQDKSLLTTSNVTTDWSFLDKLLTSHQHHSSVSLDHHHRQGTCNDPSSSHPLHHPDASPLPQTFPFQYLGYETDILKFSK